MFGSTNPFGQSSNSPFGSQSIFGQTNNASSNPFAPKPFGSTTPFGSQTGGSIFGGTSTGVFGATQSSAPSTPAFGASPSPAFGSSVPAFGASSTPAFGSSSSSFGRHLERSRHRPRLLSWCDLQCWKILTKAEGYFCELYCICKMDGDSVSHLLAQCLVARKLLSSALLETY